MLHKLSRDLTLEDRPTVAQALAALARLGGHFPHNGRPRWQVLWAGVQKRLDRIDGRLARDEM